MTQIIKLITDTKLPETVVLKESHGFHLRDNTYYISTDKYSGFSQVHRRNITITPISENHNYPLLEQAKVNWPKRFERLAQENV